MDIEKLRMRRHFLLVKPKVPEKASKGGIFIPDSAQKKPTEGTVLKVGPGRFSEDGKRRIEPSVKPGDVVVYTEYAGEEFRPSILGEERYMIIREDDVLGVLQET